MGIILPWSSLPGPTQLFGKILSNLGCFAADYRPVTRIRDTGLVFTCAPLYPVPTESYEHRRLTAPQKIRHRVSVQQCLWAFYVFSL